MIGGQTAAVTFHNTLKKGSLKVTKTSEDGLTEGMKFRLSGTSLSGLKVDEYAVTDSSGIAVFEDIPISGRYPVCAGRSGNRRSVRCPQETKRFGRMEQSNSKEFPKYPEKMELDGYQNRSGNRKPQGRRLSCRSQIRDVSRRAS